MKCLNLYIATICAVILSACVSDPDAPSGSQNISDSPNSVFIVCEGLWHYDNSSLSKYLIDSNVVIADYFSVVNGGLTLGDLANGGAIYGNYLYIVLSTPATIDKIDIETGKLVGTIKLDDGCTPRKITFVNDSLAYVSCLMTYDVKIINPANCTYTGKSVSVGPAPEGIDKYANYIFVANSGYGDYLADKPKAGTISVIDINTNSETNTLWCGPNPVVIKVNTQNKRLYAAYYNLPSNDSLGGIVEYDLNSLKELRRLRTNVSAIDFTSAGDTLLYICDEGIKCIDLQQKEMSSALIIKNPAPTEHWYSIAVSPNGKIFIGNAKNYQMSGELLIYESATGSPLPKKYSVGVNPNTILFRSK